MTDNPFTVVGVFLGSHKTIVQQVTAKDWHEAWDIAVSRFNEAEDEAYAIIAIFEGHPKAVYHERTM